MPQTRRVFLGSSTATLAATRMEALPAAERPRTAVFSSAWPEAKLASALLSRAQWKPFPLASERAGWNALPADARTALVEAGERQLGAPWPSLPATVFLDFKRTGNRSRYERLANSRRDRLHQLAVAECVEFKGRFLDEILNGLWLVCEETYWGIPAHVGLQKDGSGLPDAAEPTVDLFAAETSALVSWLDYLLGPQLDSLSPLVRKRILLEADRRILTPCLERSDFWWMGLSGGRKVNNWNPWINSNWLATTLLLEPEPKRRVAAVAKVLRSLDSFLAGYDEDGGCDEGPSYWFRAGGSLFDCLDILHSASAGAIDFFSVPLVREIGRYIYRAHIAGPWFINFADASAKLGIEGDLIYRYGKRIADEKLRSFGVFGAAARAGGSYRSGSIERQLPALFELDEIRKEKAAGAPLVRDAWMPGIQVMAARMREGSAEGLYLAAQGGHNAESHNHNDVGNFIIYNGGQPAVIDVGVETYTAKTFSAQRYDIWTMQSAYHNLPTIDGMMQGAGREFAARDVHYRSDDGGVEFSLDIAAAYPPAAGLEHWRRTLRLDRAEGKIELRDEYALRKPAGRISFTLMTPCGVDRSKPGRLVLQSEGGPLAIVYDTAAFTPEVEEIKLEDSRLKASWGDRIYRILLVATKPPLHATWTLGVVTK
jgi:hypothetical protein